MLSFIDNFPVLEVFENLNMLEDLEMAKKALDGLSGIYGFVYTPTGTSYIGSSQDLGFRIMNHIHGYSSNLHLQSAILKYGLSSFVFVILQYCNSSDILKREQHYLDILFSLPANLRYNFARFAEASFKGLTHSEETRVRMSDSHTGKTHSEETRAKMSDSSTGKTRTPETRVKISETMSGRTRTHTPHTPETRAKMSDSKSGTLNPMFGKISGNAMSINVYSLDNSLVRSFSSQVAAAEWLGVSNTTVLNYVKSGKVWNKIYTFRKSTLLK